MKLMKLEIRNFTVFEKADFWFAPGINVFIGENGTGKSHVLKALYAMLKGVRVPAADKSEEERWQRQRFAEIFKAGGGEPSAVGSLVRSSEDGAGATLMVAAEPPSETRLRIAPDGELLLERQQWPEQPDPTLLPARDVLAMCEGFVPIYDRYRISFDESYRDLCSSLEQPELRVPDKQSAELLSTLEHSVLRGSVTLEERRFYVDFGEGKREAHLVAEGLRKIATLVQLIRNGSIHPGGVLLWDEPEANMNPRLIAKLVEVLHQLAANDVQVFIATHDYLLSHKLSLAAEHNLGTKIGMKFFALHRQGLLDPVNVESAPTLAEISNNAILDEYAEYHEKERQLYQGELARDTDTEGSAR
jgi:ABC-type hemin transport system ATPase subunit